MNDHPPRPPADPTAAPHSNTDPLAPAVPQPATDWPAEPGPAWSPQAPAFAAAPHQHPGYSPDAPWSTQPYGAHPYSPAPGGYPPPGTGGTSGFAIASLIFGIFGGVLLSVIFGIVALVQIRKRGQTGRGLAIAGLTLSGCWVLAILVGVTAGVLSDRNESARGLTGGGTVSVTELEAGDCVTDLQTALSVEELPVTSCGLPHEGEVYATFDLPAGPWPGDSVVQEQAEQRCDAEFKTYAPEAPATAQVLYLHPLRQSWSRDRGVTCVATDKRGTTTGSVRN
ncbi:DUF4190 domain-containing protein [Amorphoplanes nipponensis]|uniref:DUF4190 domain-containing protein n=1 Tax=Actinoplanes nipponensis TaxID=135950 RepID=A0A919JSA3_9ACTN|nr:DUF4190 domain-containing protein [Actinoplanes nipponensis]GIE54497.1 hypothetical protein Ani05nite_80310 [Actinoplanes nipponensis]